ncbi:2-C-methyl-D-erythritol 4-phosphate cytidylyltransferase [Limnobacter sp.]|uniref:2-C-methyl-D-erythritol 4-phosphate cytidylyltransferase n=1 Tax=Limnobacter sp. TaxID=2003368 RepID=UPI00351890E3
MPNTAKYFGLIPAGGAGRRFGTDLPKQYHLLGQHTVLRRSAMALLADPRVLKVFVVVAAGDPHVANALAGLDRVEVLHQGGVERVNTVLNALNHLLAEGRVGETDWVLVHDAARPGLQPTALSKLIDECSEHVAGGLLAVPVADTVKRGVEGEGGVVSSQTTVARDGLWCAQTPQMFRAQALALALAECIYQGAKITDEASAIETMGLSPLIVQGHIENMKITQPQDLRALARLLGLATELK